MAYVLPRRVAVLVSAAHAHRGEALEQLLDLVHASYQRAGHFAVRLGPPMRSVRSAGKCVWVPLSLAPPDYLVVAGGHSWLVEAKSTVGPHWSLGLLEAHQALALDAWERQGSTHRGGVVLALDGRADVAWWLPWATLGPRWWAWSRIKRCAPGAGSLDAADCRLIGAEVRGGDWLAVAGPSPRRGVESVLSLDICK